jgi:hypothetical protein
MGVVDFGFHVLGMAHNEVMSGMELFSVDAPPKIRDI